MKSSCWGDLGFSIEGHLRFAISIPLVDTCKYCSSGKKSGKPGEKDKILHWVVVSNIFYFHPYLGKIPNLTNIFQRGWNHQLVQYRWWIDGISKQYFKWIGYLTDHLATQILSISSCTLILEKSWLGPSWVSVSNNLNTFKIPSYLEDSTR